MIKISRISLSATYEYRAKNREMDRDHQLGDRSHRRIADRGVKIFKENPTRKREVKIGKLKFTCTSMYDHVIY